MEYNIEELRKKYNVPTTGSSSPTPTGEYDIDALRKKYNIGSSTPVIPTAPVPTQAQKEDKQSADLLNPTFAAETGEGGLARAAKTIGNIPGSAFNLAKNTVKALNPVTTAKSLYESATAIPEILANTKYTGGAFNTAKDLTKEVAKSSYETLVPEAGKGLVEAGKDFIQGDTEAGFGNLERTTKAIQNDPVGQILPFLALARGAAGKMNKGAEFDSAVSKVASPVTKTVEAVSNKVADMTGRTTRYAMGQATGLNPETINTIKENPSTFTKENMSTIERAPLGQKIQSSLAKRMAEIDETGAAYKPIRDDVTPVAVDSTFLENAITKNTGLKIKKIVKGGKAFLPKKGELPTINMDEVPTAKTKAVIEATVASKLRDTGDVKAIQHLYDLWQPIFERGNLTRNEFLNFRADLAKLSKFERQIGKSLPVESAAQIMRAEFNNKYRKQIQGLDKLDETFAKQSTEFKELAKGLVDKEGKLTDSAINKIANATGKGKDLLIERLEQVVPGITREIRILKAVEDIQAASGIKVGTYTRAGLVGAGALTGGIIPGIVTAILTSPEMAVPIIRNYGLIKNSSAVRSIINGLKNGAKNVNSIPEKIQDTPSVQATAFQGIQKETKPVIANPTETQKQATVPKDQYANLRSQLRDGEILVKDMKGNIGALPIEDFDATVFTKI